MGHSRVEIVDAIARAVAQRGGEIVHFSGDAGGYESVKRRGRTYLYEKVGACIFQARREAGDKWGAAQGQISSPYTPEQTAAILDELA